jgi:hypothetical protein
MARRAAHVSRARRAKGLKPGELPSLDGVDAAKTWLEVAGRACGERRVTAAEATAIIRAASEFVKAIDIGELQRRLGELEEMAAAVQRPARSA